MGSTHKVRTVVIVGTALLAALAVACSSTQPASPDAPSAGRADSVAEVDEPTAIPSGSTEEPRMSPDPQPTSQAEETPQATKESGQSDSGASAGLQPLTSAATLDADAVAEQRPSEETSPASERPRANPPPDRDLEIIDILPRDGIPAIDHPNFLDVGEASIQMQDGELVMGLTINGDSRAYSVPFLSRHEIVNDVVGGVPVAVTW